MKKRKLKGTDVFLDNKQTEREIETEVEKKATEYAEQVYIEWGNKKEVKEEIEWSKIRYNIRCSKLSKN
ncbi:Protein of unknown function [Cotesia congregata]|uniref:Uncharacterized protein n=1 Tax=Cotesia congregata TaxID=51543 RepID=A0A8J2HAB1_COTCN|nr:Protein of unknown function [Cotesia congregata]